MGVVNNLITKVTTKFVKTASTAASTAVKQEAKSIVASTLPVILGGGFVLAGLWLFKGSTAPMPSKAFFPSFSTTHVTTNNLFFDESSKADILAKIFERSDLKI